MFSTLCPFYRGSGLEGVPVLDGDTSLGGAVPRAAEKTHSVQSPLVGRIARHLEEGDCLSGIWRPLCARPCAHGWPCGNRHERSGAPEQSSCRTGRQAEDARVARDKRHAHDPLQGPRNGICSEFLGVPQETPVRVHNPRRLSRARARACATATTSTRGESRAVAPETWDCAMSTAAAMAAASGSWRSAGPSSSQAMGRSSCHVPRRVRPLAFV